MKFRILTVAALLIIGLLAFGSRLAAQADGVSAASATTAICNVAEVMQKYSKTQALMTQLRQMSEQLRAEEKAKHDDITALKGELDELNPQSEAYSKRLEDFERANIELKILGETSEARLMRAHSQMTVNLFGEITKTCEEIARLRGFTIVLNNSVSIDPASPEDIVMSPRVLFASGSVNITQDVIDSLNAKFTAGETK